MKTLLALLSITLLASCASGPTRTDKILMSKIHFVAMDPTHCKYLGMTDHNGKKDIAWKTYSMGGDTVKYTGRYAANIYQCANIPLNQQYKFVR